MMLLATIQLSTVWGQNIFISPEGNDKNPGTKTSPIKSINKVQELVRSKAGKQEVQVIFADGIYYLHGPIVITSNFYGTEKKPVVIRTENERKGKNNGRKISCFPPVDFRYKQVKNRLRFLYCNVVNNLVPCHPLDVFCCTFRIKQFSNYGDSIINFIVEQCCHQYVYENENRQRYEGEPNKLTKFQKTIE